MSRRGHPVSRAGGFSLLEILVAFAIMAMSLGVLYRIMGNNARQTGDLFSQEQAVMLADSLLAAYETVPAGGLSERGQSAGYNWQVQATPYPTPANADERAARLYKLLINVQWADGERSRNFEVTSLRPERRPLPGGPVR